MEAIYVSSAAGSFARSAVVVEAAAAFDDPNQVLVAYSAGPGSTFSD